jgi:hypothetical protein
MDRLLGDDGCYADFLADDLHVLSTRGVGTVQCIYESILRTPNLSPSSPSSSTLSSVSQSSSIAAPILTVVVTTSPVVSNPSTTLIEHLLRSMSKVLGLRDCAVLIMCDGYKVVEDATHKLHLKPTNKLGRVSPEGAANYEEYKRRLEQLCAEGNRSTGADEATDASVVVDSGAAAAAAADAGAAAASASSASAAASAAAVFRNCAVVPMATHHGFGYLVKAALRLVRTEFVMVAQHDWVFLRCVRTRVQARGRVCVLPHSCVRLAVQLHLALRERAGYAAAAAIECPPAAGAVCCAGATPTSGTFGFWLQAVRSRWRVAGHAGAPDDAQVRDLGFGCFAAF